MEKIAIIGAGPAGLTAAYFLTRHGFEVTVLEADHTYVGGISKTVQYKNYRFDIGGHRFFSKSDLIENFWTEMLPHDLLRRPRSSRIFYRGKLFTYPLKPFEAFFRLGIWESIHCILSYFWIRCFKIQSPTSFEDWVSNQFGRRLYRIFFKTYTEKVWGIPGHKISADWAAQRIKGLSLMSAAWNALKPRFMKTRLRGQMIKTLIDEFRYPRKGPGMLWAACAEKVVKQGGVLKMGSRVKGLLYDSVSSQWTVQYSSNESIMVDHVISSAPIRELIASMESHCTDVTLKAARNLQYRDFVTVALMVREKEFFQDNWIYIHDPSVSVGRIQNFRSWSPEMVPQTDVSCYGLEYFCFEGDSFWNQDDRELIELAKREMHQLKLCQHEDVVDGCVVRQPKAYPVYDETYAQNLEVIRSELEINYPALHLVGRNGMHQYNNQDHAIMTAILTVENIRAGFRKYDTWAVNSDAEYHESGSAGEKKTHDIYL